MDAQHLMYRRIEKGAALVLLTGALAAVLGSGCTGSPGTFHLQQQNEIYNTSLDISTKIDLLWVVDNSASMDTEQDKLRAGFAAFAKKYMQPTWDIRVAVITTDAYLAHPAFSAYLNATVNGSVGYTSNYIRSRISTWQNPSYNPTLVDGTGKFTNGVKFKELIPGWGPNWAKLLPGLHDGPITALCFEFLPYFLNGATQCRIRDDQTAYNGPSHCLNPGGSETGPTQCVNTVENDTIHSGKPIISTMPPNGVPGDQAWINGLVNGFMLNVSTGSAGSGSERGFQSVLQLMSDNELTTSAFFRQGSLRAIIFVSDEDDQTMDPPASVPSGFNVWTHYACDQAGIVAKNGAAAGQPGGICCSSGCVYGSEGTNCASKTVDGYTYTIGLCPLLSQLLPVATVKSRFDQFFTLLDKSDGSNPNYFIVSIVALSGQTIQTLHATRDGDDQSAGVARLTATDRADRYIQLGNLVGNGSLAMDLGTTDYSPILNAIGNSIIEKEGTFKIARAPTSVEEMIVKILHADGTSTTVATSQFSVDSNARTLTVTDLNVILSFQAGDKILINYEPKTVY